MGHVNKDWLEAERRIEEARVSGAEVLYLTELDIDAIPASVARLEKLKAIQFQFCSQLVDLTTLGQKYDLLNLDFWHCNALSDLSPLASMTNLQQLNLSGSFSLSNLSSLSMLKTLQKLELSRCQALSDLSPLASLTNLAELTLSGCKGLHDLSPLSRLTNLQYLDLSLCSKIINLLPLSSLTSLYALELRECHAVSDLSPLSLLINLNTLTLSRSKLTSDLSPLVKLKNLQNLDLSQCNNLSNLSPLSHLTNLKDLDLSDCNALSDLGALAKLINLKTLDLSRCNTVSELSPLAQLISLRGLKLSGYTKLNNLSALAPLTNLCQLILSKCEALDDISPLTSLIQLQKLDLSECKALTNLQPLTALINLQNLNLSACTTLNEASLSGLPTSLLDLNLSGCKKLSHLTPLVSLHNLKQLNLNNCEALSDLSALCKLPALIGLDLYRTGLLSIEPGKSILDYAKNLQYLHCNNISIAPNELASQDYADNCLPRLKAWRADLNQGQADNHRIKLFVLGNGSAGKTQICRRLHGQAFDPSIPSTHGIDLDPLPLILASENSPAIMAHVWDFGGQDIYHGTHALFMDERALFVIVWNPELETALPYAEHGVAMRHRPLAYWLAMVRDVAGEDAAVVVVQSKCDQLQDSVPPPLPAAHGLRHLRHTECSARQVDGMDSVLADIRRQARLLLERYGQVLLPASWVAVGDTLRARRVERTLPHAEFEALCHASHASAPPEVVLHYLHRSGEVFYRPGLFGDQLVLDQQWALNGVYAVLDRQRSLPRLRRQGGEFDRETLDELVWHGKYSPGEQALFISLMEQCGICFPLEYHSEQPDLTRYLAPDLLFELGEVQEQIDRVWRSAETHLEVWLDYRFLHDGVMKDLLCQIGQRAGRYAEYWRYGVCFFDQGMQATFWLEAQPDINPDQPGAGRLVWRAHVAQAENRARVQRWLEDLLNAIQRKAQGQPPAVTWCHQLAQGPKQDEESDQDPIQRLQPENRPDDKPTVYVSYSHSEENTALLEQLGAVFTQRGFQLIYDNKMGTGDRISAFKREIGHGRHVLVLLDDKYLRSWHCMNELQHLDNSTLQEKSAFLQRIVPCQLQVLPLDDGLGRDKYYHFWATKHAKFQDLLKRRDPLTLGGATKSEARAIEWACSNIDRLLGWIADTLMPRGVSELSDNNFAAIFTALAANGFPVPHPDPGSPG